MEEEQKAMLEEVSKNVADIVLPGLTEKAVEAIMKKIPEQPVSAEASEKKEEAEARKAYANGLQKIAKREIDEMAAEKALTSTGSTSGTEMVPTHIANKIITLASTAGLVDKYATRWPMAGAKENVPTLDGVQTYRSSGEENITVLTPTTGSVNLSSKNIGVIIPVSEKLLRNAPSMLIDVMNMLVAKAMAKTRDQWALLGLASGEGVFQHPSVPELVLTGKDAFNEVEPEDLLAAIDLVDDDIPEEALRWAMSRSVLNVFRAKRNAVGSDKQQFLMGGFGAETPRTMWDIPYDTSPVMPKTSLAAASQYEKPFIGLIDYSRIILGDETNLTVKRLDQAVLQAANGDITTNLAQSNMIALRFSIDQDIQLSLPTKAYCRITTDEDQSGG